MLAICAGCQDDEPPRIRLLSARFAVWTISNDDMTIVDQVPDRVADDEIPTPRISGGLFRKFRTPFRTLRRRLATAMVRDVHAAYRDACSSRRRRHRVRRRGRTGWKVPVIVIVLNPLPAIDASRFILRPLHTSHRMCRAQRHPRPSIRPCCTRFRHCFTSTSITAPV